MIQYDYETRKITRDFKLIRFGERCKFSGLPAITGNDRCRKCKYHQGFYRYCVKCTNEEIKESDGLQKLISEMYREIENEAIQQMYD